MIDVMNAIPCPVCGRLTDNQIDGRCRDCFLETFTLAQIPLVLHTTVCPMCGAAKRGKRWEVGYADMEGLVEETVKKALKVETTASDVKVSVELTGSNPLIYHARVRVDADVKGMGLHSDLKSEVRLSKETCGACSRMAGGYYEAVVQIRAEGRFPGEEEQAKLVELVDEVVDRQYQRGDRLSFINNVQELPEGTDLYLGSNSTARQACRAAVERFGCRYSESPTLAGKKDGKDIYRITYSLRLPRFVPGDIIDVDGDAVLVRRSGKRISGLNLSTGTEFSENSDKLKGTARIAGISDGVAAVLVSVEDDTVQVMHPATYRPVVLKRPAYLKSGGGEEIMVVVIGDDLFILPGNRHGN